MRRATNSPLMGQANRKLVLNLIRSRLISRAEIASLTHLTRASVTMIVDELIESGLLTEIQAYSLNVGRKPIHLKILPNARFMAGVTIKRNEVDVGLINLGGEVIAQEILTYENSTASEMIQRIGRTIIEQIRIHEIPSEKVLGVGVCAPGPLDTVHGIILNPPNCSLWHGVPISNLLAEASGYHVLLEKDSNALALEEQYFGLGQDCSSFLAVQVNEGIGSGIIIQEHLYRGANGLGSELGHTSIQLDGILCDCGNRGCLEKYASIPAILDGSPYKSWKHLVDSLPTDAEAARLLKLEAQYLGCALVNAINLFDVEKVILQGDVCYKPEALLEELNSRVGPRVIMRANSSHPVVASQTESFVRTGGIIWLHNFYQG